MMTLELSLCSDSRQQTLPDVREALTRGLYPPFPSASASACWAVPLQDVGGAIKSGC
ncbi:hypothetical protein N431DRAFT_428989 [Stipitochalara longipes BDJ]|nr:hypothetical protein N431DRAFT_428989 [Stipitochalara longipes BDJ]